MFNFFNSSRPRYPAIRKALVRAGISEAGDPTRVSVVEKHGDYSGHVERDGAVVINSLRKPESLPLSREPADRADHADDQRLVFWEPQA